MTLLSEDRRRFGQPWTLRPPPSPIVSDTEDLRNNVRTAVYIDGPALLHHLISSRPSIPPMPDRRHEPQSLCGPTSPVVVYSRALEFAGGLRHAGADEVHLVMDGLASKLKEEAQLRRLGDVCLTADMAARRQSLRCIDGTSDSGGRGNTIPHLFAEQAMVEAFEDMVRGGFGCCRIDDESIERQQRQLFCIHRAHGEAEGYIALLISDRFDKDNDDIRAGVDAKNKGYLDAVVLSNDTDFLVYPSVKGFIPIHSLQFTRNSPGEGILLTGWQFLRSKLLSAYGLPSGLRAMATVAALAGCDYNISLTKQSLLRSARKAIIQSNIGGVRRKLQNNPTARSTLLAVLRFMKHFSIRAYQCKGKSKITRVEKKGEGINSSDEMNCGNDLTCLRKLACAAIGNSTEGQKKIVEDLVEATKMIWHVYEHDCSAQLDKEKVNQNWLRPAVMDPDVRLLLERGTFRCVPIIETWKTKCCGSVKSRKNAKRNGIQVTSSGNIVDLPHYGSAWSLKSFVEARKRIYAVLSVLSGRDSTLQIESFKEHCRFGTGQLTQYKETPVSVRRSTGDSGLDKVLSGDCRSNEEDTFFLALDYCLRGISNESQGGSHNLIEGKDTKTSTSSTFHRANLRCALMAVPASLRCIFVAGTMLSERDALLLFLVGTAPLLLMSQLIAPTNSHSLRSPFQLLNQQADFLLSMRTIVVACAHAKFLHNTLSNGVGRTFSKETKDLRSDILPLTIRASSTFQDELAVCVWSGISELCENLDELCSMEVRKSRDHVEHDTTTTTCPHKRTLETEIDIERKLDEILSNNISETLHQDFNVCAETRKCWCLSALQLWHQRMDYLSSQG